MKWFVLLWKGIKAYFNLIANSDLLNDLQVNKYTK